jgi:uncharacterized SAM-binding protein YcdF (DUF218 family)
VYLLSTTVSGYFAVGTLEWQYPQGSDSDDYEAIVVLSGYLLPADWGQGEYELAEDTLYRCLTAAHLYDRVKKCPIVLSGGKVLPHGPPCAEVMAGFLGKMGIRSADLLLESRSRSTYENAVETSKLLRAAKISKIVLVTDAAHLPRAVACFKKQGVACIVPCGCRYRTAHKPDRFRDFLPNIWGARGVQEAWYEWLGTAWYWWTERI